MKITPFFGWALALLLSTPVLAQQNDAVIMTVNGKPVYKSEFEAIYRKNNKEANVSPQALDEYMELFTNFRLKVADAQELGLDTVRKFRDELAGYRKQLARPYLVDNELSEDLVKEAYDRMKEEIRASHILVRCDWEADPKDTLAAWKKAIALRERVIKTGDFAQVASGKNGSEDPSVSENKGDLGYFTALRMVYPFESAAYKLNTGEISMPVRSNYGYHIIKVTDRRPARGTIRVAHILISATAKDTPENQEKALAKIQEIRDRIIAGEGFAEMALLHSDDVGSSRRGGELAPFGTNGTVQMVEEFENASFALKEDGDISPVIRTSYGYHIIKRLELKPLEPFDELKASIRQRIARDSRSQLPQQSFVNKLKAKYGFKENEKALAPYYKAVDTLVFYAAWDGRNTANFKAVMFEFAGKKYTQQEFTAYILGNQRKGQREDIHVYVNRSYERWKNQIIIGYEDARLEESYPDFRLLMNEYRDGILLFELTEQKVWSKAVKDSAGLAEFYEANKQNYMWPIRYQSEIYYAADAKIAKALRKDLKKGKLDPAALAEKYNKDSQLNLKIETGTFIGSDNELLTNHTPKSTGLSEDIPYNGQVVIIRTLRILDPAPKTLAEGKGQITSDYQNYLEAEWIKSLRARYPVEVNKEVLHSIK